MATTPVGAFRQRSTSPRVPNAPTGLALSTAITPNPDTTSFRVVWDPATVPAIGTPVTTYRVYLDTLQAVTVGANARDVTFSAPNYNISSGSSYAVQVSAVNSYGDGPKSAILVVTTPTSVSPPDAPVASAGVITSTSVIINWTPVSFANGAPTYEVYRTTDLVTPVATGTATATSATISGLTASTSYAFVVKAVDPTNSSNKSLASNVVTVTTQSGGGGGGGVTPFQADSVVDSFGINWHTNFNGTYGHSDTLAYAQNALQMGVIDLGCRYIRDAMPTGNDAHIRDVHKFFAAAGGKYLLTCGADRASGTSTSASNTHMNTHYDAIQWMGTTYVNGIVAFEGINEPNNDGVSTWYTQTQNLQTALWSQAKLRTTGVRLDSIPILGPSLANRSLTTAEKTAGYKNNYEVDYPLLGDMTAVCDMGPIHVYPGGINPSYRMSFIRSNAKKYSFPGQTIWTTEGGYHDAKFTTVNNQFVPDDIIAKYGPIILMEHVIAGSAKYFDYEGLDDVNPANDDIQSNWGLIETPSLDQSTWTKKPQWYAMKRFLSLMADPGASFTPSNLNITVSAQLSNGTSSANFRWRLHQKRNGKYYLLLWQDVVEYQNGAYKSVTPIAAKVTVGTALPVALHKPSTQGTALTSTAYQTLAATTTFTASIDGEMQVAVLG